MICKASDRTVVSWLGSDRYDGEVLPCLTIIFRTAGCSWSRCFMCSYRYERYGGSETPEMYAEYILSQLRSILASYRPDQYRMVKIFTSGSFFDPREVPESVLRAIASAFRGKLVIAETRPEYVQEDALAAFMEETDDGTWKKPLFCAIGLETADDTIRTKCIRKGFSFRDFTEACQRAGRMGAGIKAYLLHKPLFLTEREALEDMVSSIRIVAGYADLISMNPCTVQGRTELERYWKQKAYRPPYLWSVLEILRNAPVHVTCDPVGGGRIRGPHNCGACDKDLVNGIRDYSLTGDRDLVAALLATTCACKKEWEFVLENEKPFAMPLTR
ncbi:MAG TPA: archaeosine biosynthesis radical SAM protein RaSEA [Methanoregulaceae archaeon]|nr:archaeosine biosynthesis radical SAM protein RaSEA [Methanoregulaceae archaeon]